MNKMLPAAWLKPLYKIRGVSRIPCGWIAILFSADLQSNALILGASSSDFKLRNSDIRISRPLHNPTPKSELSSANQHS
jgi:hypothetical protein